MIEGEIVPLFYDRDNDGVPHRWIERLAVNWSTLGWNVTAARMVRSYVTELYEPAAAASDTLSADGAAGARELAAWKAHLEEAWPGVSVRVVSDLSDLDAGAPGVEREIIAEIDPSDLGLDQLVAQVVHGPLRADGTFDETKLETVAMQQHLDGSYRGVFTPVGAGPWGATVRVLPTHPHLTNVLDTGLVASG